MKKSRFKSIDSSAPPPFLSPGFAANLLVLSIAASLVYYSVLSAPFFFDDEFTIVRNHRLHDLANFWPPYGNRFFSYLSFGINYYFGGLDTTGDHLANIVIHIINAALVYRLVIVTFETPFVRSSLGNDRERLAACIAQISSVIFLVHPVETSAVTSITQRFASLAALFYLLSLLLYIEWRLRKSGKHLPGYRDKFIYLAALVFAVIAMKTKEISFTLPVIMVLYEVAFFGGASGPLRRRLLMLAPFLLTCLIIPVSLLAQSYGIGIESIVDDG